MSQKKKILYHCDGASVTSGFTVVDDSIEGLELEEEPGTIQTFCFAKNKPVHFLHDIYMVHTHLHEELAGYGWMNS